ncbi:hypothetical protein PQX77_019096 [Marasmius sp. AFHP31]|nr:hypothetical protein PQX77_019096 [Marasmius sp. AFHP31]
MKIRMYNLLSTWDYNEKTIKKIHKDSRLQIVITMKAFNLGINAKPLVDSIAMGIDTVDGWKQAGGRVGRDFETLARNVVFELPSHFKKALKIVEFKRLLSCTILADTSN